LEEEMTDEEQPVERRDMTWYAQFEKRLDDHVAAIEKRFARFYKQALGGFAVLGISCVIAFVLYGIALGRINSTRSNFVRDGCESQNARHDATYNKLFNAVYIQEQQHPEQSKTLEANFKFTVGLIDALAPKQNCEHLVKVSEGKAKPASSTTTTTGDK
jgi:hypothetical protein